HWHGIRQLGSNDMDGVNGVTQCPIAVGDTFTYKFNLTQYGHSWYHSHYSMQYGEGVAGPLLIHGPNSMNWDEEWSPILINDWLHGNSYVELGKELIGNLIDPGLPVGDSILVNGTGRFEGKGKLFERKFEAGKKYLIRIINASVGMHFNFAIDNHLLNVISTDFVPIKPYNTTSLSVGIGQRYSVVVEAKPDTPSSNGRYWMRTEFSQGLCTTGVKGASTQDLQRTGIISYSDSTSTEDPNTSRHRDMKTGCDDESQTHVHEPLLRWQVTEPQNDVSRNTYSAGLENNEKFHGFFRWDIMDTPMWLNFSNPTILNLDNTTWSPEYAVVDYNYHDEKKFVYMVITSGGGSRLGDKTKTALPHPMHLHGHDFAIIGQSSQTWDPVESPKNFHFDNPPRRDVAMLPAGGYLAIAFKPDNPGAWVLHCHIAWHASSGMLTPCELYER
ncbi:hypothetical protein GQ43DRAFT_362220, partial [Delitschia confertaspora ATCC 74209]